MSKGPADDTFILDMLKDSLLFESLDKETLEYVRGYFESRLYPSGASIFMENERSEHLHFIKSGEVELRRYKKDLHIVECEGVLGPGEHLSMLSVIGETNHSRSCIAIKDTEILSISRDVFSRIVILNPIIAKNIVILLAKLNRQLTTKSNYIEYFKEEMIDITPDLLQMIPQSLLTKYELIPIKFENNTLRVAIKNPYNNEFMDYLKLTHPSTQIIFDTINDKDLKRLIKIIQPYYFGTGQGLLKKKRKTKKDGRKLEVLSLKELLKLTTLFSQLSESFLDMLIPCFKEINLSRGDIIFEPGKPSEYFYLIQEGEVEMLKKMESGQLSHVVTLSNKDSFSEISLITDSKHSLLSRAKKDSKLFCIEKKYFSKILERSDFCMALSKALANRLLQLNKQKQFNFHNDEKINEKLLKSDILPKSVIVKNQIIPLALEGRLLTLGVLNSGSESCLSVFRHYLSEYNLNTVIIQKSLFDKALNLLNVDASKCSEGLKTVARSEVITPKDNLVFLKKVIVSGFKYNASDIHFEPNEKDMKIRLRIDGELREYNDRIHKQSATEMINQMKVLCHMDISERRFPQDGQLSMNLGNKKYEARASTVPTKFGEKLVLRLIQTNAPLMALDQLAPDRETVDFFNQIVKCRQGLFVVTGPTGSGKTTTLYSVLNEISNVKVNIVTIEDPIERNLEGITQIEVKEKIDLKYGDILRSVLRQDPDVIFVGEVRDKESAEIALSAALTGHLVITTLHTTSSLDVIHKFRDFGIHDYTIAAALVGSLAQRLVPAICSDCKVSRSITEEEVNFIASHLGTMAVPDVLYEGKGCKTCNGSGYSGRVPIFEYWYKTSEMESAILGRQGTAELRKELENQSFKSLLQFSLLMAIKGHTTLEKAASHLFNLSEKKKIA